MVSRALLHCLAWLLVATPVVAAEPRPDNLHARLEQFRQASGVGVNTGQDGQESLYRKAEDARTAGKTDEAGRILAGMKEGYWAALGYLNLATDYARTDLNPARALVALRVALAMTEGDADTARAQHLRNNLLVRAGYLAYLHGEWDKALGFLEKVALDSFHTPRALYLHGLALTEKGNHRAAMQSWHRARKFPLAYPGVSEAWIGMGRGYDLSGYLGQAGEAYLAANSAFESERVTLRELADRIRTDGAYKALILDARETGVDWFLADSRTLTQPRMAYLLGFMALPEAQHAAGRVAQLAALEGDLDQFGRDLAVFDTALAAQLERTAAAPDEQAVDGLRREADALLERLRALEQQAGTGGNKRLAELGQTLRDSRSRLSSLPPRPEHLVQSLQALQRQVQALSATNRTLLAKVGELMGQAGSELDTLALAYVQKQDEAMAYALDKTEQQIAHLYEYLALESLGGRQP